jgi:hypothetical protein
VHISGPNAACCNSSGVSYYNAWVTGELGTYICPGNAPYGQCPCDSSLVTYEWVVVGGTIKSGWNTAHITVDWACCNIGTVTVTATKCDSCQLSLTIPVNVHQPPAPVISGPVSVFNGDVDTYCAEPPNSGHLYSWTVINGTFTTNPGNNCITVTWGPYPACGCGEVIVCETDPITGCTGCDTLLITMLPSGENLFGYVKYQNTYLTELNGVKINLRNTSGQIIASTFSSPNMDPPYTGEPGYFAFTNVVAGTYTLDASFDGTWGGNNATDALLVQLQILGPGPYYPNLQGLPLAVADVNASGNLTGLDALYIKLRTVGAIDSYPAGDWKFTNPTITVNPPATTSQNLFGLCYGDVNASYIPTGMKDASYLTFVNDGVQNIPVNEEFIYNIKSNQVADLGAMTLFMGYDPNRFEIVSVNTTLDGMKYVIADGKIALAWSDTKSLSVKNDDPVISLTMKAKEPVAQATQIFSIIPGSEFADPKAVRIDNFGLKLADVLTPNGVKEFSMFNYPNPFKNTTNIVYTLPESGKVRLVLTNIYGQTLRVLVDQMQDAGSYTVTVSNVDVNLSQGVYIYKIEVDGASNTYVKVNKMLFNQ